MVEYYLFGVGTAKKNTFVMLGVHLTRQMPNKPLFGICLGSPQFHMARFHSHTDVNIPLLVLSFELILTFRLLQNLILILSPKHTQIHFLTHTQAHICTHTPTLPHTHILSYTHTHIYISFPTWTY